MGMRRRQAKSLTERKGRLNTRQKRRVYGGGVGRGGACTNKKYGRRKTQRPELFDPFLRDMPVCQSVQAGKPKKKGPPVLQLYVQSSFLPGGFLAWICFEPGQKEVDLHNSLSFSTGSREYSTGQVLTDSLASPANISFLLFFKKTFSSWLYSWHGQFW